MLHSSADPPLVMNNPNPDDGQVASCTHSVQISEGKHLSPRDTRPKDRVVPEAEVLCGHAPAESRQPHEASVPAEQTPSQGSAVNLTRGARAGAHLWPNQSWCFVSVESLICSHSASIFSGDKLGRICGKGYSEIISCHSY